MKVWMGHFLEAPDQWFVTWGLTKLEAAAHVDARWGEPDLRSMRPVESPGAFSFRAELYEDLDTGATFPLYLNADEGEEEVALSFGDEEEPDEDAWVVRCLEAPLGEPLVRSAGQAGALLGIRQEALWLAQADGGLDDGAAPDCECFWQRDVLNQACEQYEPTPATPGSCVVCEHDAACHPIVGVRR